MTKRDFALLAALYAAWLGCAYLINIVTTGARTPADILHQWVRFDGIYFRAIAEFGYDEASRIIRWQQGFAYLTAAFPLFPLLIHLAAPLFAGDYTLASVVVPQTLTFLVLVALFRLVCLDFSRTVAWWSVLSLLTFPTFYFMVAPYSETLFLLLVILTFHEYRIAMGKAASLVPDGGYDTQVSRAAVGKAASLVPDGGMPQVSRAAVGKAGGPVPDGGMPQVSRAAVGKAGSLVPAGIFGALASATRIVGAPMLLGAFAYDGLYNMWRAARTADAAVKPVGATLAVARPSVEPVGATLAVAQPAVEPVGATLSPLGWAASSPASPEGPKDAVAHTATDANRTGAIPAPTKLPGAFMGYAARSTQYAVRLHPSSFILHPSSFLPPPSTFLFLAFIPLGLIIYMLYQWWDFGNPLLFLRGHASSEWRVGFDLLGPVRGLLLPFYTLLVRDWSSDLFRTNMFNSVFYYFGIVITVYAWRKLPAAYSMYGLLALVVPALSGSLISMPRFLLVSFPMFIGLGLLYESHPRLRVLPPLLGLAGLLAMSLFFKTVFLG